MWNNTVAQNCIKYLAAAGSPDNARRIITTNYGGKFLGYQGWCEHTVWKYSFRDSFLYLRFFRDNNEERRVELSTEGMTAVI